MKAWILEKQAPIEERPLELQEVRTPHPGAHEIKIKNVACGVCRTDIHIAEGDLPLKKSPLILGHEIVGVVDKIGERVSNFKSGDRAGIAWLNSTCGRCKFCLSGRENLCSQAHFTGWDADGGFAEYSVIDADFAFHLGEKKSFVEIAPLMCPGIAGYRAFRLTGLQSGDRLGLYGFGPTATYVLQVAKHKNIAVYVITRSEKNRSAAKQLGAYWVGGYDDKIPDRLDGGIIFPPAGNLVSHALSQLESGGRLVLGPVTMTPIEINDYNLIWQERSVISLAHITKEDGVEFLDIANQANLKAPIEVFPFDELPEVLIRVKQGKVKGNAVIQIAEEV
ncbi:MAG: zinc-dependent alcohol dehydrogenase family protein [Deltaproteobacteria bacterium]|nr:zinc-dependent alcohol dehydrogenase family protein [Deltaproteobacteria bacterium]